MTIRCPYAALGLILLHGAALGQNLQYTISTAAGGAIFPGLPAPALSTGIGTPNAISTDAAGNLYFASSTFYAVFKIDSTGTVTRVAGNGHQGDSGDGGPATRAQLTGPAGLALDPAGNLYIADGYSGRVRKVSTDGIIHAVAGNGVGCCFNNGVGDGQPATSVQLFYPYQVAVDANGNVYIGEWNTCRVRRVSPDGIITTVVGTGQEGYSGDGGPASAAQIGAPWGLTFDHAGNLYISDAIPGDDIEPSETHIRKVTPDGIISTIAGSGAIGYGGDGGPALAAQFDEPGQLAVDPSGNVYVPDGSRIRKISANGTVTTIAGTGAAGYSGDGGPAAAAQISTSIYGQWMGVATDAAGNLYIADTANSRVRRISTDGIITTVAGNGQSACCFSGDGGLATEAQLSMPVGVAAAADGSLYISDTYNNRLRRVSPAGVISTVAGDGNGALNTPAGLVLDAAGNLYLADAGNQRVVKIATDGTVVTIAGNGSAGFAGDGGPAAGAQLNWPKDVALDAAGNLYIADTANNRVRKVSPAGAISTVAGNGSYPYAGDGGPATAAALNTPSGVAVDRAGNLYISDSSRRIRKVALDGTITTVAGNGSLGRSGDGGPAAAAELAYPLGVKVDAAGNLFIADFWIVRAVTPDGIIHTVVGNGASGDNGDGGPAATAQTGAWGLALGAAGRIYIADPFNSVIRLLEPIQ